MSETGYVGIEGYAPILEHGAGNPEVFKYTKMWGIEAYRTVSPGEELAQVFLAQAKPKPGSEIIDFGCGTGRGSLQLAMFGGLRVTMVDFARNCLDADILPMLETQAHALRFVKADLEKTLPVAAEYGYCTDVMEHIPPEKVDITLNNILRASQHCFFAISTVDDRMGALIGEKLHLTVQPFAWWLDQFNKRDCAIHWSQEVEGAALFYVSAWTTGKDVVNAGVPNIDEESVRSNIRHNIAQGWQQIFPHPTNDEVCMILGGGPSLPQFEHEIKDLRGAGVKLITLNGSYNWALEHGLTPSAQIIVDARPFNARFTKPVVENCRYIIASQCHPSVFEGLSKEMTWIWHTSAEAFRDVLKEQYEYWWGVPGGSTVLLRAIPLLRMLGFKKFHLFGCDSCFMDDKHHAYVQDENNSEFVIPVKVTGGRIFKCHPFMVSQAQELMEIIKFLGDEIELEIHGDGLLAHILHTGAELYDLEGK